MGARSKQKRRKSRYNSPNEQSQKVGSRSEIIDLLVDDNGASGNQKSYTNRIRRERPEGGSENNNRPDYFIKASSIRGRTGAKPDFETLSDFYFHGCKELSQKQIRQIDLMITWEFHHIINNIAVKQLGHVPLGKKNIESAIDYLRLKASRNERVYEEVLLDIKKAAEKHYLPLESAQSINSLFYKITQTGSSVPRISSNPRGEIDSAKNASELADALSNIHRMRKVATIIKDAIERRVDDSQYAGYLAYSTYKIPESDSELIGSAQTLRNNIEIFVSVWQKLGRDSPLRDALPDPVRINLMEACEHLIRCLKENVVDVRALRGVMDVMKRGLGYIADKTTTAAITVAVTAAVASNITEDNKQMIPEICRNTIIEASRIDNEIICRWEKNFQTDQGFDFGHHVR